MRLTRLALVIGVAAAGAVGLRPTPAQAAAPNWTYSYYVNTLNYQHWEDLGHRLGVADLNRPGAQDRLVILAFGTPALSNGVYGVDPPGAALTFASRETLRQIPVSFAKGYYNGTGTDRDSTLTLALGANNNGSQVSGNATQQGRAWSNFTRYAVLDTQGYALQVTVTGAYDIEIGWNTATASLALLDGYASINSLGAYDFGDAAGCPMTNRDPCRSNGYTWSLDQVWQKAYGRQFMFSVPEIYSSAGGNAKQWANLSRYSVNQYGYRIPFSGTLSQYQACIDVSNACTPESPGSTKNTPDTAWNQLDAELNASSSTIWSPHWSDNIRWGSYA